MKYYSLSLLKQARKHIQNGGIIAYPTESCYGLGCDPFNYQAVNNLIYLKRRAKAKGLIVIASQINQLEKLIKPLSVKDKIVINSHYWPGPFTLILDCPNNNLIPVLLTGKRNKVAVRVTKHPLVRQLCDFLHQPLVSTSANYSGFRAIKTYVKCFDMFGHRVMVLPGQTSNAKKPSTIIDWASKKILRYS